MIAVDPEDSRPVHNGKSEFILHVRVRGKSMMCSAISRPALVFCPPQGACLCHRNVREFATSLRTFLMPVGREAGSRKFSCLQVFPDIFGYF
jgi:hypothetical protein